MKKPFEFRVLRKYRASDPRLYSRHTKIPVTFKVLSTNSSALSELKAENDLLLFLIYHFRFLNSFHIDERPY